MATFYLPLTTDIKPKDIQRKFDAFVELYGESKMILKGDFETVNNGNILDLFGIEARITLIKSRYIDATVEHTYDCNGDYHFLIPSVANVKMFGLTPEVMFISLNT